MELKYVISGNFGHFGHFGHYWKQRFKMGRFDMLKVLPMGVQRRGFSKTLAALASRWIVPSAGL